MDQMWLRFLSKSSILMLTCIVHGTDLLSLNHFWSRAYSKHPHWLLCQTFLQLQMFQRRVFLFFCRDPHLVNQGLYWCTLESRATDNLQIIEHSYLRLFWTYLVGQPDQIHSTFHLTILHMLEQVFLKNLIYYVHWYHFSIYGQGNIWLIQRHYSDTTNYYS